MTTPRPRVLILCTGNSARSQLAEGWLRSMAGERLEVFSAGTKPSRVHPLAVEVMAEVGVDLSSHTSKSVQGFVGQPFDVVLTVCDHARESCPIFPGRAHPIHQSFEDPAAATGSEETQRQTFRRVRDAIRVWLEGLLPELT